MRSGLTPAGTTTFRAATVDDKWPKCDRHLGLGTTHVELDRAALHGSASMAVSVSMMDTQASASSWPFVRMCVLKNSSWMACS